MDSENGVMTTQRMMTQVMAFQMMTRKDNMYKDGEIHSDLTKLISKSWNRQQKNRDNQITFVIIFLSTILIWEALTK